jgi:hypothetical protein
MLAITNTFLPLVEDPPYNTTFPLNCPAARPGRGMI